MRFLIKTETIYILYYIMVDKNINDNNIMVNKNINENNNIVDKSINGSEDLFFYNFVQNYRKKRSAQQIKI
jgi:hypothetical protein